MSSKSSFTPSRESKVYRTHAQREARIEAKAAKLVGAKNHVSESDKSPGGFPFHFKRAK